MPDLSVIRLREDSPDVRWVLFIDGIPYALTDDAGQGGIGTLRGTGASSWVGRSEDAIGGVEVVGTRTVLGGLEVPSSIREGLDIKSGDLEPNGITIRLHDIDGTLAGLFGREHKLYDVLAQRLPPGTEALAATAIGPGGTVVNLWGRHIGTERVGPAGERRTCPALPFALVGFDHAVQQNVPLPGELAPVVVSDEPRQWSGRLVTLYEVYRDPDSSAGDATAWPTWDEQHAAGNLAWVGVLRGVTRQRGGVWELTCYGRDALLRRQLGVVTTGTWLPAFAELNLSEAESGISVFFESLYEDSFPLYFDGSAWDHTLASTTKADLVNEIAGVIAAVVDGSDTNYVGSEGVLEAWSVAGQDLRPDAGITTGSLWLRKDEQTSDQTILVMYVALHGRAWRQLGYEPETQHFDTKNTATENGYQIHFTRLKPGQPIEIFGANIGGDVPGDGYWLGRFTTVKIGFTETPADSNEWDNDARNREYRPKYQGEPFTLDLEGDQIVRLGSGTSPYIEGQLTIPHSGGDVDGIASERSRFFAFRGKVQRAPEKDPEDTVQVALLEWSEGNYGSVNPGDTGVDPAFRLVRWMDPRYFGFPHKKLSKIEYWTGVSQGEGAIEAVPLHAYAYFADDVPEYAHNVFSQILLSTGSGGGYSGLSISDGDNAPSGPLTGSLFFGSDLELADLGLGVPHQLVAPLSEIRDGFDTVPGGWASPFNRIRLAYIGPYLAQDALASLMRSRRLVWRLHGGRFGVVKLAPFGPSEADISINERDLWPSGDGNDPRAFMPDQLPNPVGYLDFVKLAWRHQPDEGKTLYETIERARDPEARARTGELHEDIEDHGLLPSGLGYEWRDEFRQLWAYEAALFFSLDHYAINLTVSRPKGQDVRPGTRVLLNNPWPHNNVGGYGLTNHTGIVTAVEIDTATHARRVELFVFAGQAQGWRHFGPMARVLDQDGVDLVISTDQHEHGDDAIQDGDGLTEPWWSDIGGNAVVQILYRVGESYTLGTTHGVVSYDAETATLTLDSAPAATLRDADRWVILANDDAQDANAFPRTLFGAIVLDNLQHGSGATPGAPFHP